MVARLRERSEQADFGLAQKLRAKTARVGVIGLGYVGLPLVIALNRAGFPTLGYDIDQNKIDILKEGRSYIRTVPEAAVAQLVNDGRFSSTSDEAELAEPDVLIMCVPTPLNRYREPDLSFVTSTARTISRNLRQGQLVCFESTTYPGCSTEDVIPVLEQSGLKLGQDFFFVYSPEREDPGNTQFETATIPKVVGADDDISRELGVLLYQNTVVRVVPVSNTRTAEAVKLTENIYRAVNIALVNELKLTYDRMGIDIWEVIDAAATKPFGFTPFYPGPGLGGHCIPVDPFYLTWKAREFGLHTRFIELSGEINRAMPHFVVSRVVDALSRHRGQSLKGARILLIGLAYKKNVDDIRESPSMELFELMEQGGARVDYHDPFVPTIPKTRDHGPLAGRESVSWSAKALKGYDLAIVATDHDMIDWQTLVDNAPVVVDTRNALVALTGTAVVVKA